MTEREAENWSSAVDQVLLRIEHRLLRVPDGVDIVSFVRNGGKVEEAVPKRPDLISLQKFIDRYTETHSGGAMEENSLGTVKMHLRHFVESLGGRFPVQTLSAASLQEHIDRRRKMKGLRGGQLSPVTLKKEMATLRAAWNWGVNMGLVSGPFPARGLVYPKAGEKPPFQTRDEIERKLAAGGLSDAEVEELWDSLYLGKPE